MTIITSRVFGPEETNTAKEKAMKKSIRSILIIGLGLMLPALALSADEMTYRSHISLLISEKCISCHGPDAPEYGEFEKDKTKYKALSKGPRLDSYANLVFFVGWPDSGAIMRRLDDGKNTKDGKPGNMYQYLGSTEAERQNNLESFRTWVGNWTLKRWNEITKEEMNGLKVTY